MIFTAYSRLIILYEEEMSVRLHGSPYIAMNACYLLNV